MIGKFQIISLFLLFIINNSLYSQCDGFYYLKSQADVNNFPAKVNRCKEINALFITANGGSDITNLDSLYFIERVTNRFEITNDARLKSIDGLKNLRFVSTFYLNIYNKDWLFPSLDTCGSLNPVYYNETCTLSAFKNIKSLSSIVVSGNVKLDQIGKYNSPPNNVFYGITIDNNTLDNELTNILPQNLNDIKKVNLGVYYCKNLKLTGLEGTNINLLKIREIYKNDVDFKALSHVHYIEDVYIENYTKTPINVNIIPSLDSIGSLMIFYNKANLNLFEIFKNVKNVKNNFLFVLNENYTDITWLNKLPIPTTHNIKYRYPGSNSDKYFFKDNKLLDMCNIEILCEALEQYPDSITFDSNSRNCTKENLIKYCEKLVSVDDNPRNDIKVYPNPVFDILNIDHKMNNLEFYLKTINNATVLKGNIDGYINLAHLPSSLYLLEVFDPNEIKRYNFKIIKI